MPPISLPTSSGVILLPDTALFPHGNLPLHIFEPRYREMLNDALEGDFLFSVGTLTGPETADPGLCTAPIGTLALIRASHELPDGRSEMMLQGVCRVHFRHWTAHSPYPHTAIEPFLSVDLPADEAASYATRLRHAVSRTLEFLPSKVAAAINHFVIEAGEPFAIADVVAQHFVADPKARRTLLEEPEVAKRIEILIKILERSKPRNQRD